MSTRIKEFPPGNVLEEMTSLSLYKAWLISKSRFRNGNYLGNAATPGDGTIEFLSKLFHSNLDDHGDLPTIMMKLIVAPGAEK